MAAASAEMTLGDYSRIVKRRFPYIVLPLFVVIVGAYYYANSLPLAYRTIATIEIQKNFLRQEGGIQRGWVSPVERASFVKMASAREISDMAADYLRSDRESAYSGKEPGLLASEIRNTVYAEALEGTNFIQIGANGRDPVRIADYCNAYAQAVVQYYSQERRHQIVELSEYLTQQISAYEKKVEMLRDEKYVLDGSPLSPNTTEQSRLNAMTAEKKIDMHAEVEKKIEAIPVRDQELLTEIEALRAAIAAKDVTGITSRVRVDNVGAMLGQYDAQKAELARLLDQYTPSFPAVTKVKESVDALEAKIMESVLTPAKARLEELEKERANLPVEKMNLMEEQAILSQAIQELPEHMKEVADVSRELELASSVLGTFQRKLEDIKMADITPADRLVPLDRAEVPKEPYAPNKRNIITIAGVIGLLVGIAIAFLIEAVDTSLTALRDVERVVQKPVLAVIPKIRIPPEKYSDKPQFSALRRDLLKSVPMMVDQRSPAAEAYRTLRTVLQNRFFNRGNKTLLVTSTTPQEGKTTTTVNLALACADAGLATVLVGGNLRHPVLGKYFAIDRATGLHEVLSGQLDVESALQPTGHNNLTILNSGGFSRRPAELLASKRFDDTLAYLKTKFEVIIVDSPPALPVADAATIAPKVDGVLIVYLVSVAPRDALVRCKETMDEVGANIIGVVFNDIRGATQADYSGYYYYHKYAGDEFSRL